MLLHENILGVYLKFVVENVIYKFHFSVYIFPLESGDI